MRHLVVVLLVLALVAPLVAPPAGGQFVVHDPISFVQELLDYVQMLADYYQQYQILVSQFEQIEAMVKNLEQLEQLASDNPARFLLELRQVLRVLRGIVYVADDVLVRFDEAFTPEVSYELSETEAVRLRATLGTLRTLLAGAEAHARASEDSASALSVLTGQLDRAEGNLEALQAVGALTTQVATEVTRSAEVQALAVNALVVREAHALAREEQARLTLADWMNRGALYRGGPAPRTFDPVPSSWGGSR